MWDLSMLAKEWISDLKESFYLWHLRVFYNVRILTCITSIAPWVMGFQCLLHSVASLVWIICSPRGFPPLVKIHIGESPCLISVVETSVTIHPASDVVNLCWRKTITSLYVGKALMHSLALDNIRNFILVRNSINEGEWDVIQNVHLHRH